MMARSDTIQELASDLSSMLLNERLERKRPDGPLTAEDKSDEHTLQSQLPARFKGAPQALDGPNRTVAKVFIMAVLNLNLPHQFCEILHVHLLNRDRRRCSDMASRPLPPCPNAPFDIPNLGYRRGGV